MYDFAKEILKFHDEHVRLTNNQRNDMKNRREANLKRIKHGLEYRHKPKIVEAINQGGYAQKSMVQPPELDKESRYDIDLGVVFDADATVGARTTRGWVRDAIAQVASGMKYTPDSKKKCVRVIYADGYQCDFPVFRRRLYGTEYIYELAAGDYWERSDPRSMNNWVETQVSRKSLEISGNYQLRRIIRLGKFYCKTHSVRLNLRFPVGLVATALFTEAYAPVFGNDDDAFYKTLKSLSNRSVNSPVYANGIQISDNKDTDRIKRLVETAKESVKELESLAYRNVSQADACKAWKKVFRHSYFDKIAESEKSDGARFLAGAGLGTASSEAMGNISSLTQKEKMDRLESAVNSRKESGAGTKPWSF